MKLREDAAWLQGRSAARKALRKAYKKREGPEPHPQDWTGGASLGSALRGQSHVLSEGVSVRGRSGGQEWSRPIPIL